MGGHATRAKELLEVTATDSQSFLAMIHNSLYLDRYARPHLASSRTKIASWVLSLALTGLTFLVAGRPKERSAPQEVILLGSLILTIPFSFNPLSLIYMLAFILVVATIASLGPVWGSTRIKIAQTLRYE